MVNYCNSELKWLCLAGIPLNIMWKINSRQQTDSNHFPNIYMFITICKLHIKSPLPIKDGDAHVCLCWFYDRIGFLIDANVTSISCTLTRKGSCHSLTFDQRMQSLYYAVTGWLGQRVGTVKWLYLVRHSCAYQGKITLNGVEWREKEMERKRGAIREKLQG